jgi:hypothetical protein
MKITDSRLRLSASDVANYLACQHLSRLDLQRAQGTLRPPHEFDLGFQDVVQRDDPSSPDAHMSRVAPGISPGPPGSVRTGDLVPDLHGDAPFVRCPLRITPLSG